MAGELLPRTAAGETREHFEDRMRASELAAGIGRGRKGGLSARSCRALAFAIDQIASEEWDRILLRREYREGEPNAGSSYWDGRQAAFKQASKALREACGMAEPNRPPRGKR